MDQDEIDKIVHKYYIAIGGPASYSGFDKIKRALMLDKYEFDDVEIKSALKRIEAYNKFRKRNRSLPVHIAQREVNISGPGLWYYGDSMYIQKGWPGILKFAQVWIDGFSKRISITPIARLSAKNSVKSLMAACVKGYPDVCYTDRGTEFLGEFSQFLKEKDIKQIFTSSAQANKSFYGNLFHFE